MTTKRVIILFLDGVGLGEANSEANPFMHVDMVATKALLGVSRLTGEAAGLVTNEAALLGLDAQLDTPGLPQSATGQTTILTGQNAAAALGEHYGPYPNPKLRDMLASENLFTALLNAGKPVAYANAYPNRFLERLSRGKGRLSANTFTAHIAGLKLRGRKDLQKGRAISALLSNQFWPEPEVNLPPVNAYQAGGQLVALAQEHTLTFFEFWYSDLLGHKMEREESLKILGMLDDFLRGILDSLDFSNSLLLVVSDHGNFEDWTTKKHTHNPSLTILAGNQANRLAPKLRSLVDVKPVVLSYLNEDLKGFKNL